MLSEFGEKAKAYRCWNGWLLYDMAMVMRISTATLSGYESGKRDVPKDVADALETLILCEGKRGPTKDEIKAAREIGRGIRKLVEEMQGAV